VTTDLIGAIAGTLTTLALVPQVTRCWRRRSAEDLSVAMLVAFTTGVALWTVYGVRIGGWPIILSNGITLMLALALLTMKIWFEPATAPVRPPASTRSR
jgi:MtN3 and saliva related transmembrane protein